MANPSRLAARPKAGTPPEQRFEQQFIPEPNSGCWLWTTTVSGGGYGTLLVNGKRRRAHRYSWELANGPIPRGLYVLHRCDTRECVNPEHLFLGTHLDNIEDMRRKGRRKGRLVGERINTAKLDQAQVREIRRSFAAGEGTKPQLAARFGVTRELISKIVRGELWRHVASPDQFRRREALERIIRNRE